MCIYPAGFGRTLDLRHPTVICHVRLLTFGPFVFFRLFGFWGHVSCFVFGAVQFGARRFWLCVHLWIFLGMYMASAAESHSQSQYACLCIVKGPCFLPLSPCLARRLTCPSCVDLVKENLIFDTTAKACLFYLSSSIPVASVCLLSSSSASLSLAASS